jgi:hypothetical protein
MKWNVVGSALCTQKLLWIQKQNTDYEDRHSKHLLLVFHIYFPLTVFNAHNKTSVYMVELYLQLLVRRGYQNFQVHFTRKRYTESLAKVKW